MARASAFLALALAVVRGDRVFTRDEVETDLFDLYVLRRAGDLLPFERARCAMLLGPRGETEGLGHGPPVAGPSS